MTSPNHPPPPAIPNAASHWPLKKDIAFLNHGSFGAVPRCVAEEQECWRAKIEAEPVEMIARRGTELLDAAKKKIGAFLGMTPANFGMVTNATEGINAVLRSLTLSADDELLTTDHVYNAVRQAMRHTAARFGAGYREIPVPLPLHSAEQIVDRVIAGLSPRTKLLVIDHITSPTAIIFPIEQIIAACKERNIDVLIDGAHAPGMIELNIESLNPAYYAGNLHKWTCGPRGSAFIWVRPDRQQPIHPTVISHLYEQGLAAEFSWQGTRDLSAALAVPRAIQFLQEIGSKKIRDYNHHLTLWGRQRLAEIWRVEPVASPPLLGSMATFPLPGKLRNLTMKVQPALQQRLYSEHAVEAPLIVWNDQGFVRICCQIYNTPDDIQQLAAAIMSLEASFR